MKVVHCKREKFDVYIGRNPDPVKGKYGNPFSHKKETKAEVTVQTIEQAMEYCERWLKEGEPFLEEIGIPSTCALHHILRHKREAILSTLPQLKGKVLGCWCKIKGHELCHGDIYVQLLKNMHL